VRGRSRDQPGAASGDRTARRSSSASPRPVPITSSSSPSSSRNRSSLAMTDRRSSPRPRTTSGCWPECPKAAVADPEVDRVDRTATRARPPRPVALASAEDRRVRAPCPALAPLIGPTGWAAGVVESGRALLPSPRRTARLGAASAFAMACGETRGGVIVRARPRARPGGDRAVDRRDRGTCRSRRHRPVTGSLAASAR
jgi:hypothetical protein